MADLAGAGPRLREIRTQLELSQGAMATRVGLSNYRSWQQYEAGQTLPSGKVLFELARLGFEPRWILTGGGPRHVGERLAEAQPIYATDPIGKDFVLLPRYEARPSAGDGAVVYSEQVVDHLAFRSEWVDRELGIAPENLILVNAVGDSMADAIRDGDLLLVNVGDHAVSKPGIFVLAVNEDLVVKRVVKSLTDDAVTLSADNPAYGSQTIRREDFASLRVVGRVVWAGGRV